MSCPATGIRDFPIQNGVNVTQTLNDSIYEPSTLDIQWAKRGTAPSFQQNFFTEGIYSSGEQSTTLRYKGALYTLKTVQLVDSLHRSLVLSQDKSRVSAEIVMVFESASALVEKFVILCIPILDKSSTNYSPYLEAVRLDRLSGKPIGLDDLLPSSKVYTSYSTCLRQVLQGTSTAVQAIVLVFTAGLPYPKDNLSRLQKKMKSSPTQLPRLTTLVDGLIPKTNTSLFLITSEIEYKNYLRTSEYNYQSQRGLTDGNRRTDSTDSYKCVPLKPDDNVKNNQIVIDTDKGVPLSQVLKEKQEEEGDAKITPGMVERMIAGILGTAIGVFILSVIAYIFSRVTSDNADDNFPWLVDKTKDMLPIVFVSIIVGIIGFLIGFFTSTT